MHKMQRTELVNAKLRVLFVTVTLVLPLLTIVTPPVEAITQTQITLEPNCGWYDSTVHIHGINFSPNAQVTISWETLKYWKLFSSTSIQGVFDIWFNVPDGLKAGNYAVSATDEKGNTTSANFTLYAVYVDATSFGIRSAKQFVQWKYDNRSFYCNIWKFYHNSYNNFYNIMLNSYGTYILRLIYNGVTYIFDLAGGKFNAWPQPLIERVNGFTVKNVSQIQGNVSIYDKTGSVLLATIIVDIRVPLTPDNYYSVIFTITSETRLDDLSLYVANNLDVFQPLPNWAYYEKETDSVYQYYGPNRVCDIPEQYTCYAGFGSVTPVSTHHDAAIYYTNVQYVTNDLRDYDFNYRDRNELYGDSFGDPAVGLQWNIGPMNTKNKITIPTAFAVSDETLDTFSDNMAKSKLFALQFISCSREITLAANEGPGSSIIGITGQGFMPYAQVYLRFSGLSSGSFMSDSCGAFQGSFVVPTAVAGIYNITATDACGLQALANFTVVEVTSSWLLDRLDSLNATLSGLIIDSKGQILAKIETSAGPTNATLREIEAHIVAIIADAKNGILAKVDTKAGEILAKLDLLNAKLTDIDGTVATIETDVGTIKTDVASINGRLTEINGRLATIETDIGTIKTDIGSINGRIVSIDGNLTSVKTDVGAIKTNTDILASIDGKLVAIDGRLATIETDIGTVRTDIININGQLVSVKGDLTIVKTAIGNIETYTSDILVAMNAKLVVVDGRLATIQSDIGTIKTDIGNINGRVVSIEGNLATVKTDIGTIKTSTANILLNITAVKGNIAEIHSKIGETTSIILAELSSVRGNLTQVKGGLATIETSLGTVTTSIENIHGEITAVKGDIVTVQTSVGKVQANLADIDPKVTITNGKMATIQTSLGTLIGTVTAVHGDLVAIKTHLGIVTTTNKGVESSPDLQGGPDTQPTIMILIEIAAVLAAFYIIKRRIRGLARRNRLSGKSTPEKLFDTMQSLFSFSKNTLSFLYSVFKGAGSKKSA